MSMTHVIAWIFELPMRLLLPSSGRHRAADLADGRPEVQRQDEPTTRTVCVPHAPAGAASTECANPSTMRLRAISGPPDRHRTGMVRPYVIAHEQRRKSGPRVELLCAPHGMAVIR
ncbi:hypothetical protein [Streptomyces malaysiensis]|uniref:hypothetical protein n=1 Tax=Streptomyces malaysiensis TaxID=92644 RepID=UPI002B31ECD7|nr:hypothetical protein R8789_11655 [Streptomyces malaysiensis]